MEDEIRELSISDYDEIIRIWAISGLPYKPLGRDSRELIAQEMLNSNCCFFGLYQDDLLIGVAIANFDGRRGWVNRVSIDPDYRGMKNADKLISCCNKFLEDLGALVICALIEDINYPSISTFNNAGYKAEGNILYFTKRQSDDA